jgi:hypothetical protein
MYKTSYEQSKKPIKVDWLRAENTAAFPSSATIKQEVTSDLLNTEVVS